jgi:predicted RNA binding protein YcfA (HicA-like mRNA interferase family)
MRNSDIIIILKNDGWYIHNIRGSHHQFKHKEKSGKVTIPHPKTDLPIGTTKSILKQAGINWRDFI